LVKLLGNLASASGYRALGREVIAWPGLCKTPKFNLTPLGGNSNYLRKVSALIKEPEGPSPILGSGLWMPLPRSQKLVGAPKGDTRAGGGNLSFLL